MFIEFQKSFAHIVLISSMVFYLMQMAMLDIYYVLVYIKGDDNIESK